jgi:thioredoxin reductase
LAKETQPDLKFLSKKETGIKIDSKGDILCDPFLETSVKDIFAAGGVCSVPSWFSAQM